MESERIDWAKWFEYSEESPSGLIWKVGPTTKDGKATKVKAGDKAGAFSGGTRKRCGSWKVKLDYTLYLAHRIIWEIFFGKIEGDLVIDHIDGNSGNNNITNLRLVEPKYNSRNQRLYLTNKSGVCGVFLCKGNITDGPYWRGVVESNNLDRKQLTRSFMVKRYGDAEAFRLACEWRNKMIEELNANGAGYTERHGT